MFCVYESNGVESPIHLLLHCLTPPEQGCGELFSLDKSNGKVTGVPNHRVKNISLPLSHPLALARSSSMSNSVANKTNFRKKKCSKVEHGYCVNNLILYDATLKRKGKLN